METQTIRENEQSNEQLNKQQNTPDFNNTQHQTQLKELDDKKKESKKEDEEKAEQLKLQLEIQSFIERIQNGEGIIDFDSMEKIGEGGTHNVYDPNKSEKFIVKINRTVYEKSIEENENGTLNEDSKNMAESFITNRNNKFQNLYKSFGIENCLYETMQLVKIKYQNHTVQCPIVIQEKSDLYGNEHISFPAAYIESIDNEDKDSYENLNNVLLGKWKNDSTEKDEVLLTEKDDKFMYKINAGLENFIKPENFKKSIIEPIDEGNTISEEENKILNYKYKVEEFLEKIKNHYENTGEIIDLVGHDNVIFYQKGENRNFKIGSVIKNTSKNDIEKTLTLLENNPEKFKENNNPENNPENKPENKPENNPELNQLNNILAYTRILNYLGIKLGKGRIIDLNLNEKQIKNLNELGK